MPHYKVLSGTALKRLACILMLIDHVADVFLQVALGIPYVPFYYCNYFTYYATATTPLHLIVLNSLLRGVGRLAFPLFAFLLVEGFLHTKNATHYLLRLICFGILAEPFFDFAFFGAWSVYTAQNIYFTLALGVIAMMILQQLESVTKTQKGVSRVAMQGLLLLALVVVVLGAQLLATDYDSMGVLLIAGLYAFRKTPRWGGASFALFTAYQFPATLALVPLACYDGTRGNCAKWERWGYYLFYPAHIALLCLVRPFL